MWRSHKIHSDTQEIKTFHLVRPIYKIVRMDILTIKVTEEWRDFIQEIFKSKGLNFEQFDPKEVADTEEDT